MAADGVGRLWMQSRSAVEVSHTSVDFGGPLEIAHWSADRNLRAAPGRMGPSEHCFQGASCPQSCPTPVERAYQRSGSRREV